MWLGGGALAYLTCAQPCFFISTTENRQSNFDVKILKFPLPAAAVRLALVAWVQGIRQADQLSYHPVPDHRL